MVIHAAFAFRSGDISISRTIISVVRMVWLVTSETRTIDASCSIDVNVVVYAQTAASWRSPDINSTSAVKPGKELSSMRNSYEIIAYFV